MGNRLTAILPTFARRLMDAAFATDDQDLKVLLAHLELWARQSKGEIEGRLEARNRSGARIWPDSLPGETMGLVWRTT